MKAIVVALMTLGVSACTIPRGAALQSEIVKESGRADPTIDIVPVTRTSVKSLLHWPRTGWSGGYRWLSAGGGAATNVIRPLDTIDLVIWDNSDNSLLTATASKSTAMPGLQVGADGAVFIPYVGDVVISGMTPARARAVVQEKLLPIMSDAQVQLAFSAGQGNSVDLVSGVARPGTHPLPSRNYKILSALSQGGGISSSLRHPIVRLQRSGQSFSIPAKELFADPGKNVTLQGGDQVIVEEDDRFFTALGATGKEELVYFDREAITALEAISMFGGISDSRADPKGILVLREYPASQIRFDGTGPAKEQVVFSIDLTSPDGLFGARNFAINPGDTVLATESPVTSARTIFGLIGSLVGVTNAVSNVGN